MATEKTFWEDARGVLHNTEALARQGDISQEIELILAGNGQANPRVIADAIVDNWNDLKAYIRDRKN